jgi:putative phosphoesterase
VGPIIVAGLISDTHVRDRDREKKTLGIPPVVLSSFQECDTIIHVGDLGNHEVLQLLSTLAPIIAVKGNHDKKIKIPTQVVTDFKGWRTGIVHGHGSNVRNNPLRIIKHFKECPDVLIFGHTHRPMIYGDGDVILLNPGSTSVTLYTPYASFMKVVFHMDRIEVMLYILDKYRKAIEKRNKYLFFKSEGVT